MGTAARQPSPAIDCMATRGTRQGRGLASAVRVVLWVWCAVVLLQRPPLCVAQSSPTAVPSVPPTVSPSASPTVSPTVSPSASPTTSPTLSPTTTPTTSPTTPPTISPTVSPTVSPTASPTPICIHTGIQDNETTCRDADCSVFFQGVQCPGFCPEYCTANPTTAPAIGPTTVEPTTAAPTATPTGIPTPSCSSRVPASGIDPPSCALTMVLFGFPPAGPYFDCSSEPAVQSVCPAHCDTCTFFPTAAPTAAPTLSPQSLATSSPTLNPTLSPTLSPTTSSPTLSPSVSPSSSPTSSPSTSPTVSPTHAPSTTPTGSPTTSPTVSPTLSPSISPTRSPTASPTVGPTGSPTTTPTVSPTASPTRSPTVSPSVSPSASPTLSPTTSPSLSPTVSPTLSPTMCTVGQQINSTTRICQVCTEPGTWMNLTSHNLESCIPWSKCAAGEFSASPGTSLLDRVCATCPDETFRSESEHIFTFCTGWTPCSAGFVRSASSGDTISDIACVRCDAGTFMNLTAHLNTTCFGCVNGTFANTTGKASCAPHTICTPPSEVLAVNGSATADSECKVCNLLGQFSQNGDCFPCQAGTFQNQIAQSDCNNMSLCPAGSLSLYNNVNTSQTLDRQCAQCGADTFQANATTSTTCTVHRQCAEGTYQTDGGTPTTDTTCTIWSMCAVGEHADDANTVPWYNKDRACLPCNASNFVSADMVTAAGVAIADGHSLTQCQTWAAGCGANLKYIEGSESPTSDRACVDCPTGTEIASTTLHLNTSCTNQVAAAAAKSEPVLSTELTAGLCIIALLILLGLLVAWRATRTRNAPEDMEKLQAEMLRELGMSATMSFGDDCLGISIELSGEINALVVESADLSKLVQQHLAVLLLGLPGKPMIDDVQFDATSNSALVILSPPNPQVPLDAEKVVRTLDRALQKKHVVIHHGSDNDAAPVTAVSAARALPRRVPREISSKRLLRLDKLGEGNFAEVFRAQLDESDRHLPPYPVALKVLKGGLNADVRKAFLREAALMAMLDHPNIVHLVGVSTFPVDLPPLLLMQFCDRGSLETYLHDYARDTATGNVEMLNDTVKLTFAGDVCRGLAYLASCRIIHRDVASRNVLLDAAYICRVGDFGLSQSLSEGKEYVRMYEQVAVRWAAREVLKEDKFSAASDVWSFGVVLHEIMTMAELPYKDLQTNTMVIDFITNGGVMERHEMCPPTVYNQLILPCWTESPEDRIVYSDLLDLIEALGGFGEQQESDLEEMTRSETLTGEATANGEALSLEERKLLAPSVWHLNLHLRAKLESVIQEGLRRNPPLPRCPPSLEATEISHMNTLYTQPLSADTVCPRDMRAGCAYVDTLRGKDTVGSASALLSYSWSNRAFDIFDALAKWCVAHKRTEQHAYIWICSLCVNQHRMHTVLTPDELSAEFGPRVTSIGRLIPFMDQWDSPLYITRAWCLFELYTAIRLGQFKCKIDIIMSPKEEKRFKEAIVADGYDAFDTVLSKLRSENAQATYPADLHTIFELIQTVPGKFDKLDATVKRHLRQWAHQMGGAMRSNPRLDMNLATAAHHPSVYITDSNSSSTPSTSMDRGASHAHPPAKQSFYRRAERGTAPADVGGGAPRFPLTQHSVCEYDEFRIPPVDDAKLVLEIPHLRGHMHMVMQRLQKNKSTIELLCPKATTGRDLSRGRRMSATPWVSPASPPQPPLPSKLPPIRKASQTSISMV